MQVVVCFEVVLATKLPKSYSNLLSFQVEVLRAALDLHNCFPVKVTEDVQRKPKTPRRRFSKVQGSKNLFRVPKFLIFHSLLSKFLLTFFFGYCIGILTSDEGIWAGFAEAVFLLPSSLSLSLSVLSPSRAVGGFLCSW